MAAMKLFVWDFHGVLEKGNEKAVIEISNKILENAGYQERFSEEAILKLYGKKWYQYFECLLPQEPTEKHLYLQKMCVDYQLNNPAVIKTFIKPNDHVNEVLEKIAEKHKQILISNTSKASLLWFMDAVGVTKFFPSSNVLAINSHKVKIKKSKSDILRAFLNRKSFSEIVVIGDNSEDLAMKNVAGVVSYLYAHPGRDFAHCDADYKINDLREILREI